MPYSVLRCSSLSYHSRRISKSPLRLQFLSSQSVRATSKNQNCCFGKLVQHETHLPQGIAVWGGLHSGSCGLQFVRESSDRCSELQCHFKSLPGCELTDCCQSGRGNIDGGVLLCSHSACCLWFVCGLLNKI